MPVVNLLRSGLAVTAALLVVLGARPSGVNAQGAPEPLGITVQAEVLESSAPVEVHLTQVTRTGSDEYVHGVIVTWRGNATAMLDDVRFAQHVTESQGGDLVLAGRGCGASWDETVQHVFHPCTADLQLIKLAPGAAHEYPVRVIPEVGPLQLGPGTYVAEQVVEWWVRGDEAQRSSFTIRLKYKVGPTAGGIGLLTPAPAASGVSLGMWSGGAVDRLPRALSYWVTYGGAFVGYIPGAPERVNGHFLSLHPGGWIPAETPLLLVR